MAAASAPTAPPTAAPTAAATAAASTAAQVARGWPTPTPTTRLPRSAADGAAVSVEHLLRFELRLQGAVATFPKQAFQARLCTYLKVDEQSLTLTLPLTLTLTLPLTLILPLPLPLTLTLTLTLTLKVEEKAVRRLQLSAGSVVVDAVVAMPDGAALGAARKRLAESDLEMLSKDLDQQARVRVRVRVRVRPAPSRPVPCPAPPYRG
eukprot:scaffold11594_cov37-Phaeocystis_antarctica.AAC.1